MDVLLDVDAGTFQPSAVVVVVLEVDPSQLSVRPTMSVTSVSEGVTAGPPCSMNGSPEIFQCESIPAFKGRDSLAVERLKMLPCVFHTQTI